MTSDYNEWMPIDDLGRYWVHPSGKVASTCRMIPKGKQYRVLKPNIIKGYYWVNIYHKLSDGTIKRKFGKPHRLVAEAFIPNPENKPCVNHIDANKLNNHVSNLEWCTVKENAEHASSLGLNTVGKDHHLVKITEEDAIEIKHSKTPPVELMKKYDLTHKTIRNIQRGITWKHLN